MFYGIQILGKKRPLGTVWLLGCGKKIPRRRILREDIAQSCEMIMHPAVPLALRLSAVLMSGVIKCFYTKQQYILDDCHEAIRTFRQGASTARGAPSASRGSRQQLSSRGRTITLSRSRADDETLTVAAGDVAAHVEEIFLQEFLSTQQPGSAPASQTLPSTAEFTMDKGSSGQSSLLKRARRSLSGGSHGPRVSFEGFDEDRLYEEDEGRLGADADQIMAGGDQLMEEFFFVGGGAAVTHPEPTEGEPRIDADPPPEEAMPGDPPARRGRRVRRVVRDAGEITLPRDTIKRWLRDASDIVCERPLVKRRKVGGLYRLDFLSAAPACMGGHVCQDLQGLFKTRPRADPDQSGSEGIEPEVLRQEDRPRSPTRPEAFPSSSSEEGGGRDPGLGAEAPFEPIAPLDLDLPATDDFLLAETDEGIAAPGGSLRQYRDMAFSPLMASGTPVGSQVLGSPYLRASEITRKVLDFLAEEARDRGGQLDFAQTMIDKQIGRNDAARVFFHALVLQSRALISMQQLGEGNLLVAAPAA